MSNIHKQFTDYITIGAERIPVEVTIEVGEDELHTDPEGDFDFGDEVENRKYLARFESGELFIGYIHVHATALGEVGTDSVGACHLFSNNAFNSEPYERSVAELVEAYDMVGSALAELRQLIISKANRLAKFAGQE